MLIDGRTVYSPLFSGVYWDAQDVVLEDVERIEVISGPGGTLWGANAVNGVINVITRSAVDTQGALVAAGTGNRDRRASSATAASPQTTSPIASTASTRPARTCRSGRRVGPHRLEAGAGGISQRLGRGDTAYTLQGDGYGGELHQAGTAEIRIGGREPHGRSTTRLANGSDVTCKPTGITPSATSRTRSGSIWTRSTCPPSTPSGVRQPERRVGRRLPHRARPGPERPRVRLPADDVEPVLGERLRAGRDHVAARPAADGRRRSSKTTTTPAPSSFRRCASRGPRPIASSCGARCRAPSGRRRGIDRDLYSPTNPAVVDGVPAYSIAGGPDFQSEVATRRRGRLPGPADPMVVAVGRGVREPLRAAADARTGRRRRRGDVREPCDRKDATVSNSGGPGR